MVFDLYITLTDFEAERRRPALGAELASSLGVDPDRLVALMRSTFDERALGAMGDIRSTMAELARRLGAAPDEASLRRAVAMRREHELYISRPRAGVLEVMRRIRGLGYKLAVLSDCTPELRELWPVLPYDSIVDAAVFSCELGCRKPAVVLYREVARQLGVPAAECLYVGDGSSGELTGAAAAGMAAVMLRTPFGEDFRYDAETKWQGLTVGDLAEVIPLLVPRPQP